MKTSLIIFIAVLVLVGGYYFMAGPPNRVATPDKTTKEAAETLPVNTEDNTEENEPEPAAPVAEPGDEASAVPGDDVGMEFPIVEDESVLTTKEFTLDGFNFGYDVTEIRVNEGDVVTINLTVSDGFHDWVVDEFDAATEKIRAGGLTSVTFTADKKGTYEFYCSVGSHRAEGMVGTLIVE